MDFRKRDNITVDCLIFGLDNNGLNILLYNRTLNLFHEDYPEINDWVLTGRHVFISKTLEESADLIFKEITGQETANRVQFKTYGNPTRLKSEKDLLWIKNQGSKTQTMTVAYYFVLPLAVVTKKNKGFKWFSINSLPNLGFDHEEIIKDAYNDLKMKIMTEPIIFDLLPPKFTLNELQLAFEAVLDVELDNRNFRRKALNNVYIVPLNEKRKSGTSKKPSKLYTFSRDVYDKVKEKEYIIKI